MYYFKIKCSDNIKCKNNVSELYCLDYKRLLVKKCTNIA